MEIIIFIIVVIIIIMRLKSQSIIKTVTLPDNLPESPVVIDVNIKNALTKDAAHIDMLVKYTVIATADADYIQEAKKLTDGLSQNEILGMARDIILSNYRMLIATLTTEELLKKEEIKNKIDSIIEFELKKIGLEIIVFKICEISDTAGQVKSKINNTASDTFGQEFKEIAQKSYQKKVENTDSKTLSEAASSSTMILNGNRAIDKDNSFKSEEKTNPKAEYKSNNKNGNSDRQIGSYYDKDLKGNYNKEL